VLRQRINRLLGGAASRRTNRAQYRDRTLVLANHWDGSVQQFYHFFLGYFMPLSLWLDQSGESKISVRDCGPMNIWFELLAKSSAIDIEIVPPGSALHSVIGDRTKHVVLAGMDDPKTFRAASLQSGLNSIRKNLNIERPNANTHNRTLIVDRTTSEDFYHDPESETHMSGRERRHVPNLSEISIDPQLKVEIVDFARVHPIEQIELAQETNTMVAQHGAGLVHMLWMPAGSRVIEIAPPLPPQVEKIFERLAATLGHRYCRLQQEGVHAPIDLENLERLILQ
jgi:hypothetical protein